VKFLPEPRHHHDSISKTGILLVNLGTPEAPTAKSVRRYLKEFLWDPRVVEIPRPIWWLILNAIILNVRPGASAKKYAAIWTRDGSPLRVHTERQAHLLRGFLGTRIRSPFEVAWAMRYGSPSIAEAMSSFKAAGCDRVLVLPLYPQYAASTTASAFDSVAQVLSRTRNIPAMRMVRSFHDHPAYISSLAGSIRKAWGSDGPPDVLLMSFHGLPRYTLDRGDPYHCECHKTARLLAEALQLRDGQWKLAFQSRFGRTEWLKPYTSEVLDDLAKGGKRRVDVACPGFVSDCLETLEEIGIEAKARFLAAGGKEFRLIPCLNEDEAWINALVEISRDHLAGWVSESWDSALAESRAKETARRASALDAR
jgi:ferrochelatase